MFVLVFSALFAFFLLYYFIGKKYSYWRDRGFLETSTSFPFGSLKGFSTKITTFQGLHKYYLDFKGKSQALGLYFFFSPTLMTLDLELIKNVFIRDFASFHDRGFYYNKEDDPLSANLLTLEGHEWRERRIKLSPIFTSGKMKMMFDIVDNIGDKFIKALDKEVEITQNVEMRQILSKFSIDVISNVAFGIDSNCLEDPTSEFYKHGKRIVDLSSLELLKLFFTSSNHELSRKLHLLANPKEPSEFLHKVFLQTIRERETSGVQRNDFVQLLLKLRDSVSLSVDEMAAEAFIFFSGGFETSSSTLTFCLYELALNIEIQEKLRNEVLKGLEANDGKLNYELLFQFEYMDMVVKETLRKYPIIPGMMRKCLNDYKIPNTDLVIPKGINVLIPIYSIHHDPEYYPNPEKFDPERFSPENSEDRNPITFLAFGEGPRSCIGTRFGMLQVKLGLVKLLTSFKFSVGEKTVVPLRYALAAPFVAPEKGMWLKVQKRTKNDGNPE